MYAHSLSFSLALSPSTTFPKQVIKVERKRMVRESDGGYR